MSWWEKPGWPKTNEFEDVIYNKKDGVAKVIVNKTAKLNAWSDVTFIEMQVAINDAAADPTVGVLVLTSVGDKAFSSGGDVKWEKESRGRHLPGGTGGDLTSAIRKCLKPVIAAVKGYCIGAGNWIPVMCDLTIAADNAIFGQTGPRIGSAVDGFVQSYLIGVVGEKKAREIWMLCRRYNAQEALQMGLINAVVPLEKFDEEVNKWCQEILSLSPTCLRVVKASFNSRTDCLLPSYRYISDVLIAPGFAASEEADEGKNAFLEKRKADYMKFRKPKGS